MVTLKTIKNQEGEMIPEKALIYNKSLGIFTVEEINCYSSSALGLGTCRCNSHEIWETTPVSRSEAIDLLEEAGLKGWGEGLSPEEQASLLDERLEICIKERIVLAGFKSMQEFEEALAIAYKLRLNPLPKVREMLKGLPLTVSFAYDGQGVFFEAEPREAVFAVFLDSEYGTVRTELSCSYCKDGKQYEVQEEADISI